MSEKPKSVILFALIGIAFYLWFSKSGNRVTQSAGAKVSAGVTMIENLVRGERNNNPGNIRVSTSAWRGKIVPSQDSEFEQFDTAENGIRALSVLLMNYYKNSGANTVRKIIERWAPNTENNTESYINSVSRALTVSPDTLILPTNPLTLFKLTKAIIRHENGRVSYSDAQINAGIAKAYS